MGWVSDKSVMFSLGGRGALIFSNIASDMFEITRELQPQIENDLKIKDDLKNEYNIKITKKNATST